MRVLPRGCLACVFGCALSLSVEGQESREHKAPPPPALHAAEAIDTACGFNVCYVALRCLDVAVDYARLRGMVLGGSVRGGADGTSIERIEQTLATHGLKTLALRMTLPELNASGHSGIVLFERPEGTRGGHFVYAMCDRKGQLLLVDPPNPPFSAASGVPLPLPVILISRKDVASHWTGKAWIQLGGLLSLGMLSGGLLARLLSAATPDRNRLRASLDSPRGRS